MEKRSQQKLCAQGHELSLWGRSKHGQCRACTKDTRLKATYGISLSDYIKIWQHQNFRCPICNKLLNIYKARPGWNSGTRAEVDHDHRKRGRESIRGITCGGRYQGCNRKLGKVDDAKWLMSAWQYITEPPAQVVLSGRAR